LQTHILGAIAEFERERIRERVLERLRRAAIVAAERLGVSRSTIKRCRPHHVSASASRFRSQEAQAPCRSEGGPVDF